MPVDGSFLAKQETNVAELRAYEGVLAEGLRGFLNEMVMINGGVMLSYICNNQHAALDDLIASSMERRLKPGRLSYANHAEIDFDWGAAPSVALAMELRDDRLTAFFSVVFGGDHVAIDIRGVHFTAPPGTREDGLRLFAGVVADARFDAGAPKAA